MTFSQFNTRSEEFFDTWGPRVEKAAAFVVGAKALLEAADKLINSDAFKSLYQWCKDRVYQIKTRLKSALKRFLRASAKFVSSEHKRNMAFMTPSFLRR